VDVSESGNFAVWGETKCQRLVLIVFLAGFGAMVFGILKYKWYINEIGGVFLAMGVLGLAGLRWEKWAKWMVPLLILWVLFAALALIPPGLTNWGPA
jgi:uncharacterized ion transporter superfamily protein YfcC